MKFDIVFDRFRQSLVPHKVKFSKVIDDGNSNVYKKLLDSRLHDNVMIMKIEFKNHLLRNFCNKLKDIAKNSKLKNIQLKKKKKL